MFYNIIHGLKNLWYWLPIIWKDRDWDYAYILIMLRHKLKKMAQFFESDVPVVEKAPEIARQMYEAIDCLDELIDNKTFDALTAAHQQKWGEGKMLFERVGAADRWVGTEYANARPDEQEQAKREMQQIYKLANEVEIDAQARLLYLLRIGLGGWWD